MKAMIVAPFGGSHSTDRSLPPDLRVAVYTCITGGYDPLSFPTVTDHRVDYFCFSDASTQPSFPWQAMRIDLPHLNAKDQQRYIKMHPHEYLHEYDLSIYLDGSIQIVGSLLPLIAQALDAPEEIFIFDHPDRTCVSTEGAVCAHSCHDWIWTIASQMRKYRADLYPIDNGLFETNVMIVKRSERVRALMEMWWSEYCKGAKRDQLSLTVVAWKLGIRLGSLGKSDPRFGHRYFKLINHPKPTQLKIIVRKYLNIRKYVNRIAASLFAYSKLFGVPDMRDWRQSQRADEKDA